MTKNWYNCELEEPDTSQFLIGTVLRTVVKGNRIQYKYGLNSS